MTAKDSKKPKSVAEVKAKVAATLMKTEALVKAFPLAPAPSPVPAVAQAPTLTVKREAGKTDAQMIVSKTLSPCVGAGLMVQHLIWPKGELDLATLSWYFKDAATAASGGDLGPLQQMLAVQARALDQIFYSFASRAATCQTNEGRDACLKIALKAQSQSRCTVESLAVIQQGPTIFAKQANVNNGGQQQVNNGTPAPPPALPAAAAPLAPRVRARKTNQTDLTKNQVAGGGHG